MFELGLRNFYLHDFFESPFLFIDHALNYHGNTKYPGQSHEQRHSASNISNKPEHKIASENWHYISNVWVVCYTAVFSVVTQRSSPQ